MPYNINLDVFWLANKHAKVTNSFFSQLKFMAPVTANNECWCCYSHEKRRLTELWMPLSWWYLHKLHH